MSNLIQFLSLSILISLTACFDHEDVLKINKSGYIHIKSYVEITDPDLTKKEIKEKISEKIDRLTKDEGWTVRHSWTEKSKPYKIEFTLSNTIQNLYEIHQRPDAYGAAGFFIEEKVSDTRYLASFENLEGADNRTIRASNQGLPFYKGENGEWVKVDEIENPKSHEYILIVLE